MVSRHEMEGSSIKTCGKDSASELIELDNKMRQLAARLIIYQMPAMIHSEE